MASEKAKYIQWFAGFYEGEGYLSNDRTNNNRIRLGIAQNDRTPLDLACKLWGGTIKRRVRKSPASDKICTGHEWTISHNSAITFIQDIKPFMLIPYKIQQVDVALQKAKEGLKLKFKCKDCENEYASPAGRRRHWKSVHQNSNASNSNELRDNQIAGNP